MQVTATGSADRFWVTNDTNISLTATHTYLLT